MSEPRHIRGPLGEWLRAVAPPADAGLDRFLGWVAENVPGAHVAGNVITINEPEPDR